MEKHVDAYGHLFYVAGDEDYMICYDYYVRENGMVELQAVVDCESSRFIEEIVYKVVPKKMHLL
jgi:hypothetical protein